MGSADREAIEGAVEEPSLLPGQRLRRADHDILFLTLVEEQIAVLVAPVGVEQRTGWVILSLHAFGLAEESGSFLPPARRVKDTSQRRPIERALDGIAALVG